MTLPDLSALTLKGQLSLLVIFMIVDVLINIVLAIIRGDFALAAVLTYLRTHVLLRVFPILMLILIGHGLPVLEVPPIEVATAAGIASLGLYALETLGSLRDGFQETAAAKPPGP
jgi:hypothetical protein